MGHPGNPGYVEYLVVKLMGSLIFVYLSTSTGGSFLYLCDTMFSFLDITTNLSTMLIYTSKEIINLPRRRFGFVHRKNLSVECLKRY